MNRRGFTLIEVLISIMILATLSVLSASGIRQAIQAKKKIQDQIDDVSKIRDAIRLMERDINLAYHHRDFEKEMNDAIKKLSQPQPQPGQPPPVISPEQPIPVEAPRKDPTTYFIGNDDNLNFVTLNNSHMVKDSRSADFIEVGYALKDCKSVDGKTNSKCIWRRTAIIVDDDVTQGGDEIVLLENVNEFTMKYIGKGKQDWVNTWRTDKGGDAVTKDRFPQAVQISLTIKKGDGDKSKKYSMQVVVPIHFPNNNEGGANATDGQTDQNQQQSTSPVQ